MKPKTVWITGAILLALILRNEVVSWLLLAALAIPVAGKVLEISYDVNNNDYQKYYDD